MGPEFASKRNDGTIRPGEPLVCNAFKRLQYVCAALRHVADGSFPFEFQGPLSCRPWVSATTLTVSADAPPDLGPEECLQLLVKYSELREHPSLWCIWNFINVMYWQLRDMHHPESPLNCACMPDVTATAASSRDAESKRRIKCEIVAFIARTAREFATRQIKKSGDNEIAACIITNFSRTDFNGTWKRMSFDNDNYPVFQSPPYYLYYRSGTCLANQLQVPCQAALWLISRCRPDILAAIDPICSSIRHLLEQLRTGG